MATTSHGLSVYVSSCVKNPLDARTGQSLTYAERSHSPDRFAATDPGPVLASFRDEEFEFENHITPGVRASFADVEAQLKCLTDEQFYRKLQELKDANRKTLEECEILYKEKYGSDEEETGSQSTKEMVERMFAARLAERTAERSRHVDRTAAEKDHLTPAPHDAVRDMSAKPPPVPYASKSLSSTTPARSAAMPQRSVGSRHRPGSAPAFTQTQRRAYSLDEEDWRRAMRGSSDLSDNDVENEEPLDPELVSAITKIRDMWQNFKIDDYTRERRHSSASMTKRKERKEEKETWRHRITIPKPFQMTLRDQAKEKTKTRAQIELEEKRLQRELEEEAECQKKFQAQPAPAHIYLPLYDEMNEKNEARRRYVRQYTKDILQSQVKPFNFEKRELAKKEQQKEKETIAERIVRSQRKLQKQAQKFVAKPVPAHLFDDNNLQKHLENEELRKIRIKMRAREMLQSASMPSNMALQQQLKEEKERRKLTESKKSSRSKRRPKSAHDVPDYDLLYRDFQKELARRRRERDGTVVQPFALETGKRHSHQEKVLRDVQKDVQSLREDRWPFRTARSPRRTESELLREYGFAPPLDTIPFRATSTSDRRAAMLKSEKLREQREEEARKEEERRRAVREAKLRKYISEHSTEGTPRNYVKDRLKQHKHEDKARLEQYQKDLEEMQDRVQKRPFMFQRESQTSAGKAAEKKFRSTLRNAGIDEDFVQTRSSGAARALSEDEEDAGDTTYTQTAAGEELA